MSSTLSIILLALAGLQGAPLPEPAPPLLEAGKEVEGAIDGDAPAIETPKLAAEYTKAPTVGERHRIVVENAGPHTIDLRSLDFDAYLVLRDENGAPVAEDDDGLYGSHARIVAELSAGMEYRVEACALHGERGAYRLILSRGAIPPLDPRTRDESAMADQRERIRRIEERKGETEELADALNVLGYLLWARGRFAEALPVMERALAITERGTEPGDPRRAKRHSQISAQLQGLERLDEARAHTERSLAIRESSLGAEHPETTESLRDLAGLLRAQGKLSDAKPLYERVLAIRERTLPPQHPETGDALNSLGALLYDLGEFDLAYRHLDRARSIRESRFPPNHPLIATTLSNIASVLTKQGKFAEARVLYERALAIREASFPPNHPVIAKSLAGLAAVLESLGDSKGARPLYERTLAIREEAYGPDHPEVARTIHLLAPGLHELGETEAAVRLLERARTIVEARLAPGHPDIATTLDLLASIFSDLGNYEEARPLCERALAIREASLGPDHAETAMSLNNLAVLLVRQGRYDEALPLHERAVAIQEKALGAENPSRAAGLHNLASLRQSRGEYELARPLRERALALCEASYGPDHVFTASSLLGLASLLQEQGKYREARPLTERALAIRESKLGADHSGTGIALNDLGLLLHNLGLHEEAQRLLERAVSIQEAQLGAHCDTARSIGNLAIVHRARGDLDAAQEHFERSLAVWEEVQGHDNPQVAMCLHNLAILRSDRGEHEEARRLLERALAIQDRTHGRDHPETILFLESLTLVLIDCGELDAAQRLAIAALAARRSRLGALVDRAAEADAFAYVRNHANPLELLLAIEAQRPTPELAAAVHSALLDTKGQVFRRTSRARAELLAACSEEQRRSIDRLRSVQGALSDLLSVRQVRDRARLDLDLERLRRERNALEAELVASLASTERPPVSPSEVAGTLPPDSVLLDFFVHRAYRATKNPDGAPARGGEWQPERVGVWVLRRGDAVARRIDLGESAEIDRAIRDVLSGMEPSPDLAAAPRGVGGHAPKPAAAGTESANDRLWRLLWAPLAGEVENAPLVIVSPDRSLARLPLAILRSPEGRFLIEDRSFRYLESPALLVERPAVPVPADAKGSSALLVGALDYQVGSLPANDAPPAQADPQGSFEHRWPPLPGTRSEVDALAELHERRHPEGRRTILRGAEGTESRLKSELPLHSIVHLATHGYFDPGELPSQRTRSSGAGHPFALTYEEDLVVRYLPGYLVGLVCAGAERPSEPGRENGLLSAEEVSWLDLSRCDLVVLSACQTGLGESRSGEGLMSLRRGFAQAGARTVISSLWQVPDDATRELMTEFYARLWRGESKELALRGAQHELLRASRDRYGDPRPESWGAFVLSGAAD